MENVQKFNSFINDIPFILNLNLPDKQKIDDYWRFAMAFRDLEEDPRRREYFTNFDKFGIILVTFYLNINGDFISQEYSDLFKIEDGSDFFNYLKETFNIDKTTALDYLKKYQTGNLIFRPESVNIGSSLISGTKSKKNSIFIPSKFKLTLLKNKKNISPLVLKYTSNILDIVMNPFLLSACCKYLLSKNLYNPSPSPSQSEKNINFNIKFLAKLFFKSKSKIILESQKFIIDNFNIIKISPVRSEEMEYKVNNIIFSIKNDPSQRKYVPAPLMRRRHENLKNVKKFMLNSYEVYLNLTVSLPNTTSAQKKARNCKQRYGEILDTTAGLSEQGYFPFKYLDLKPQKKQTIPLLIQKQLSEKELKDKIIKEKEERRAKELQKEAELQAAIQLETKKKLKEESQAILRKMEQRDEEENRGQRRSSIVGGSKKTKKLKKKRQKKHTKRRRLI